MRFKWACATALISTQASAFVHISQLKPRLPVSPEQPQITFLWNGDAPPLTEKDGVADGAFAESDDVQLMEALLHIAVNTWTNVPTAYVVLEVERDPSVHIDQNDEIFAIVVEPQDSEAVAAAALPTFITNDPHPSPTERNEHIISDCDITVSDRGVAAKTLLRTLVHELGHCLGLGHPHSSYRSIMSYSTLNDDADLALDDKAGVSFLYPQPGESEDVKYLTTCGSIGGRRAGGLAGLVLSLPILAVSCRRTYKRKM